MALSNLQTNILEDNLIQILFVILSAFLTVYISLFYFRKMIDQLFSAIGSENTFRKSIILSLINSIPKTLLILTNLNKGIEDNGSLTNGLTVFNITLALPLLIINSPKSCYINHNSFLKDFLFLELAFLHQFSNLDNAMYYLPLSVPFVGLAVFLFFLFSIFKLPESLSRDSLSGFSDAGHFQLMANVFRKSFKHLYDILIVDLEGVHKFSGRLNWRLLASPILNTLILLTYNRLWNEDRTVLMSLLTSFVVGIILIKSSKTSHLLILIYIYGIAASIFHVYTFLPSYHFILNSISLKYNLNINYLQTVMLPLLLSLLELFTLLYYSSIGHSTLAICSLIYSTVYNMLFIKPIVNILALRTQSIYTNNQPNCNQFCYVFGIIASVVIMFNYVVRNHRVSKDLGYILLFTYFFFNISFLLDYKIYIIRQV